MNENATTPSLHVIELSELNAVATPGPSILSGNIDLIQNVKVRLSVRVGEATVSIGELMKMQSAQVLRLDTPLDAPVDILLEDNVVARGRLVAVDDNFGVQITELPSVQPA